LEQKIRFFVSETRAIEQEAIAARNKALMAALPKPEPKKKKKKKPKTPDSVDSNAMADLEEIFLRSVQEAAVEFIETVPASQPASPTKSNKSEEELQEQHGVFEERKDCFTDKVEVAELKFLQAMEEIEYGRARSMSKEQEAAMQKKMLADAEKARLAADEARRAAEEARRKAEEDAKRLEEERRRLQEEAERLARELAALRDERGENGKRWKKEEVAISFGDNKLVPADFKCQVSDKGAQIEIDIEIKSPTSAQAKAISDATDSGDGDELERLRKQVEEMEARRKKEMEDEEARRKKEMEDEEARRKKEMEDEEARRKKEMEDEEARRKREMEDEEARRKRELEEEARRMEEEARRKKAMEEEEARRKKAMDEDEAKRRAAAEEEARRRQAEFDEQKKKMQAELDAARKLASGSDVKPEVEVDTGFFDPDMHQTIKENIQEVLGHLENISEIITEKAEEQASSSGTKDS
jgi:hypothetical protein